jgi:hypothetical protein
LAIAVAFRALLIVVLVELLSGDEVEAPIIYTILLGVVSRGAAGTKLWRCAGHYYHHRY